MQHVRKLQELFTLTLDQLGHGNARPAFDDLCNFLLGDLVAQEIALLRALRKTFLLGKLLFQLRQLTVFQTRSRFQIIFLLGTLDLGAHLLDALTELLHLADSVFLVFPLCLHAVELITLLGQLLAQFGKSALRQLISLVFQRGFLDLHLDDLPADDVQLGRHGVHLRADHGAGLVDQVDGLVGQETVGDIAVGKRCGSDNCGIGDLHAVEYLVAFLEAAQNGNGVLDRRLLDHDGLEPALERGILFDIFAVFVQRGRADAVQLAACQHGLQEVARIHAALGLACADDGVQLVDEQENAAFGIFYFLQDGLQTFLKFAAVFCACNQCAHIQREDRLVLQGLRYVAAYDALCQTFGDGSLADARFADQDGIVFRFAGKNTDDVANLVVTADDRVGFLLACLFYKVGAIFFQRLVGVLGIVRGHAAAAANGLQNLQAVLTRDAIIPEQRRDGGVRLVQHGKEQMLDRDIVVAHGFCGLLGGGKQLLHAVREIKLVGRAARSGHGGQLLHRRICCGLEAFRRHAHALEKLGHKAAVLL